jgi:DNA ligase-1
MARIREEFRRLRNCARRNLCRAARCATILGVASFQQFAEVCQALSQTQSRLQMAEVAGDFLASLDVDEAEAAARFMIGRALPVGDEAKLNISGRAVWRVAAEITGAAERGEDIFAEAVDFGDAVEIVMRLRSDEPAPSLTISEVERQLREIAIVEGRHARQRKLDLLRDLLVRATSLEARYLAKILIREMRHGMSEGVMLEAIAHATAAPIAEVRRINMMQGDPGRVLRILRGGSPPQTAAPVVRPLKPMLAQPAATVADAFAILGPEIALEHKLDGARVQIHGNGGQVRIFSRRLNEITPSLPEIVERLSAELAGRSFIFDGEVIAVDQRGNAIAFQELMRRFRRIREVERLREQSPVRLFLFDILGLDGELLIDHPYRERFAILEGLAQQANLDLAGRCLPANLEQAQHFYQQARAAGFEGVMAKRLDSRYSPGIRGRGWLKIKGAQTLDLVIVAADWGYGRRHGWLSNYHLAARTPKEGEFAEVGKTFKGFTDEQFREMTERLLALKTGEHGGTVEVRPEVVVEVAYSDIQRSPQYSCGMALRFARIVRVRDDKGPEQANTIEEVSEQFSNQIVRPNS